MSGPDDEQVLRENLRVNALSPEALARIRRATEAEWRAQVGAPRRGWMAVAAAAAVLLVAAAGAWQAWMGDAGAGAAMARLARSDGSGVVEVHALWRDTPVRTGAELRSGSDFIARGGALLALHGGGNLRIAPDSKFEVLSGDSVRLERGEMYVDIPPGQHASASFTAITAAGEFRHVGTQFSIAVSDGATRLRVREGRVQWQGVEGLTTVPAGIEVLIGRDARVTRSSIEAVGEHWTWTEAMAPQIDIEDRPLGEFLDWVARETGRRIVYADDGIRRQVEAIRMHGSVRGLPPMQALKAVMASTSLHFDLPEGAIRVSFAGDSPPPRT
ncbi:MAG TPA: FecR domain-containing protein [Steroidobacteraceae bacterium]|nr:FecR domain-containing protein [Steroidobacteraceae bacterium]